MWFIILEANVCCHYCSYCTWLCSLYTTKANHKNGVLITTVMCTRFHVIISLKWMLLWLKVFVVAVVFFNVRLGWYNVFCTRWKVQAMKIIFLRSNLTISYIWHQRRWWLQRCVCDICSLLCYRFTPGSVTIGDTWNWEDKKLRSHIYQIDGHIFHSGFSFLELITSIRIWAWFFFWRNWAMITISLIPSNHIETKRKNS